ncbi:class I SAM-dependent methyltransferase [Mucilaginibacter arboris]|uniref:Methyltransferase domain-containing protein n=1 Tax=Mucilaginibacter arboris TaxID=2682090 RepID=A0A7K1SRR6_9SPHI|nr:class I SAM-dependent methyltransferase [Mucilaginibacter arboris]MVN20005.1 methyltransferase domain-containing protein [Mucilaginibacter arboris]
MSEQNLTNSSVISAYDNFYDNHDEAWRMLGAKYKAQNILEVCKGKQFVKVLEVGAGDGSILYYLDQWNFAPELYAIEISESGVEHIKNRNLKSIKEVQVFDGYHIPYADQSFDLVILAHVLEHVEYERMLLRELKRIAKYQVIEVPRDYRFGVDAKIKHFLAYGHINVYTPSSLRYLLRSEGFEVLADKTSMIQPEVTRFNTFINQKKKKSLLKNVKIEAEYQLKKVLNQLVGKKLQEKLANAYTVLCSATDKSPQIF